MSADQAPHWLHPLLGDEPGASLLVGGVGHLLLNREEETVVTAALEARVLPLLRDLAGARPITLFTGLAPGADLLLMDRAGHWCARNNVQLRKVGLCAVPVPQLLEDWVQRAEKEGYTLTAADHHWLHSGMHAALKACDQVLRFYAPGEEAALADTARRQENYRLLAAVLAEHSDVLVAVLQDEHLGQPGGTAEVVAWRQNPLRIPPQYSTRAKGTRPSREARLILVNPMPAKVTMSAAGSDSRVLKTLASAEAALKAGNELLANDILFRALKQGVQGPDLHYLRVQVLAGIGSTELAQREYETLAPPPAERDERWMTLKGRIKKDLALRSGSRKLFMESASHYLDAWRRFGSSYSAINAASMAALGLDETRARDLARQALAAIAGEAADSVEQRYYAAASRAEAALILGDHEALQRHLADADALPIDSQRKSRTLRQLKRLCAVIGVEPSLLAALKLPPLIVLRRLGLASLKPVEAIAAPVIPAFAANASLFAGLCDSYDLVLAEALLQHGHSLHLVLPYRAERVIEGTRLRLGEDWALRLERCLAAATRVHAERGFLEDELGWAASNVTERALGLALLAASRLGGSLQLVEVNPASSRAPFSPLPSLDDDPQRAQKALRWLHLAEPPAPAPAGRRMVGLIFADFAGFQRLEDVELPHFWSRLMCGIAQRLERHGESILLRHTWGDALHVVTSDARTAAAIMVDIQQYLDLHRLKPAAPLAGLTLRIAGHYAPAFEGHDPIHAARTYYGTQLSLTARIEPVTPPGQIYATEAFAARLAIEDPDRFSLEYAGEIELAKRFGDYRLYSLRRLRN
ncbi:MAG: adenylate/guanylate cyclase domain-containing protein [Pseudomonadota bacterium]